MKGGKQPGGGRPSGSAWAHKRPRAIRTLAQANRVDILQNRDPLAELIRLGFEASTEDARIKALSSCLRYLYPALSMSVIATAEPAQAERLTSEMLVRELSDRIARLPAIEHEAVEIEAETTLTDADTD